MIIRKSPEEIELMRQAGHIVAETHRLLRDFIKPGISTAELESIAEKHIVKRGGRSAFKGYQGFPGSICVAVNDEVVHGIPGPRRLKSADIVGIDIGVEYKGYYADAAATYAVGTIVPEAQRLIETTEQCLWKAISRCRPGNRLSDASQAIQVTAEKAGYSVVRDFVGHGIGRSMHEEPQIPNFGPPNKGPRLEVGMVFALEPMVNMSGYEVKVLDDGWTVVTCDGSLSAHFEHTIAITEDSCQILTEQ